MASKRNYKKRNAKGIIWFFLFMLLMVVTVYSVLYAENIMKPIIASIAEVKVQAIVTQTVDDAIKEQFVLDTDIKKLLNMNADQDGNVSYVEANTAAMNELAANLTIAAQEKFQNMEPSVVEVPAGSLLGSQILSQFGPDVKLKVLPIAMSKANFRTEFESCGINQTKYKVFLDFESKAKVLAPFSMDSIEAKNTILVAEAIIVGKVPGTYIQVPEDKILDAVY